MSLPLFCILKGIEHPDEHEMLDLWYQPPNRLHLTTQGWDGPWTVCRVDVDFAAFISRLEETLARGFEPGKLPRRILCEKEQVKVIPKTGWEIRNRTRCDGVEILGTRDPKYTHVLFFDLYHERTRTDGGQEMYVTRQALWEMINRINSAVGL